MIRGTKEVIEDLKKLIDRRGYIYSLCLILFEDFHVDLNKIHEIDNRTSLSVKECSLIVGFLVQGKIDFTIPASTEDLLGNKHETYRLMKELQSSLTTSQSVKYRSMMERQKNGEQLGDTRGDRLDFFVRDGGMVEPMFYAGDGIYDFQYLEYLESKYNKEWLKKNRNFDIDKNREIAEEIKRIRKLKSKDIALINLKEVFPNVARKARNKLKRKLSKDEIDKIEHQQLTMATFYQYRNLFPDVQDLHNANGKGWNEFYERLLDLFIVTPSDFGRIDGIVVKSFFDNFSFLPGCNEDYEGPGHFNILNSRPLIKLEQGRYFVPVTYLVAEAIYESPFYWMWEDKKYRDILAKHRGEVGEEIAYNFFAKVFGINKTFRSVTVETKKGEWATDIDVLCLLGNKALCVQVKSKKLTLSAKRGDFDQLMKDFKGAVQDAYNQGVVSREAILSKKAKFYDQKGSEILSLDKIDEVYIVGVTTENYPSLVHQVHTMLEKKSGDPYPLFVSAFDLELLVHYLVDPYDFLYYVRQRIELIEYFIADEELAYLGYHLMRKLAKIENYNWAAIDSQYVGIVDRNYYPYKLGVSDSLNNGDDPLGGRWKDPQFDLFLKELKLLEHPKSTEIVFHLLDYTNESKRNIVDQMIKVKTISGIEKENKSLAVQTFSNFGLSYFVLDDGNFYELRDKIDTYAKLRKYKSRCKVWLGLGAMSKSPHLIDHIVYLDKPWEEDIMLENNYKEILSKMGKAPLRLADTMKTIGRNELCPCNSGKKFKKCCGL